jgi:phosphatidylglycerol:prolipoprotein diacylglycerol transferase
MQQVLFEIPGLGLKLFGYGFMLMLAFLGAMTLAARRAARERLDPEIIYDLAVWVFLGGLLGARLFYVVQYWGVRVHRISDIFKIWEGGIVLYGSLIGASAALFGYWLLRRFPLLPTLDAIAPSLALGVALGRFGCFLNGCCYGDRCNLPWAVRFPKGSPPWGDQVRAGLITRDAVASLPVHPTQLYSTIDGLILLVLLLAFYPLRRRDGEVMALLLLTYPLTRFLIEWLRNDESVFVAGMTIRDRPGLLGLPPAPARRPLRRPARSGPHADRLNRPTACGCDPESATANPPPSPPPHQPRSWAERDVAARRGRCS